MRATLLFISTQLYDVFIIISKYYVFFPVTLTDFLQITGMNTGLIRGWITLRSLLDYFTGLNNGLLHVILLMYYNIRCMHNIYMMMCYDDDV